MSADRSAQVPVLGRVEAPWTEEQVDSLNDYQSSGVFHPFTCGACRDRLGTASDERLLYARADGWHCVTCDRTQSWAWEFMADDSWEQMWPTAQSDPGGAA